MWFVICALQQYSGWSVEGEWGVGCMWYAKKRRDSWKIVLWYSEGKRPLCIPGYQNVNWCRFGPVVGCCCT